jgi:PAS domain-containing protein
MHILFELPWRLSRKGWDYLRIMMEARQPFRDFIHSRVLRDESRRWFTASGDPIFANGKFIGYRGVGRDITAQ